MRRLNRTLGLSALMLAAVACDDDRTSVLTPVGEISIGTPVGSAPLQVPTGTVSTATLTVTASWLRAVTGASYRTWYVSRDPVSNVDVYTPAFGTIIERFRRDSLSGGTTGTPVPDPITGETIRVVDTIDVSLGVRTGTYAGSDNPDVFEAIMGIDSAADVGTTTPAAGRNAVVVSLGDGSGSDGMVLFRRTGVAGNGAMTFGIFGGTDVISAANPADYVFGTGGGTGTGNFRGAEVSVDFRELRRPPTGYFYRGFLVDADGAATLVDTLRSAYNALASISRVSLFDADVNGQLPGIAVTSITLSQVRDADFGSFAGQKQFILTLDPKGAGAAFGGTVILLGDIPERATAN